MAALTPIQLSTPSTETLIYIYLYKIITRLFFPLPDYSNPTAAIAQMRAMISRFNNPVPMEGVTESTLTFKTRDDVELHILIFTPTSPAKPPPLMLKKLGLTVACPQYRLAPEHKFPTGVHDAWDALRWIATNTNTTGGPIQADPTRGFIVGGVSAGGNFANVLSHLARDENLTPPLTGVMLSAHQCLPPSVVPAAYQSSYLSRSDPRCMDAPVLDRKTKAMFEAALEADERNPMFACFNWPTGHGGLPATYIQVCGMDINRDEAMIYESVLREEGSRTRMEVYPGMPDIFWSVFTRHSLTKKWWVDTLSGVSWLLGKEAKL